MIEVAFRASVFSGTLIDASHPLLRCWEKDFSTPSSLLWPLQVRMAPFAGCVAMAVVFPPTLSWAVSTLTFHNKFKIWLLKIRIVLHLCFDICFYSSLPTGSSTNSLAIFVHTLHISHLILAFTEQRHSGHCVLRMEKVYSVFWNLSLKRRLGYLRSDSGH